MQRVSIIGEKGKGSAIMLLENFLQKYSMG